MRVRILMSCDEEIFKHLEHINKRYPIPQIGKEQVSEVHGYDPETDTFTTPITEVPEQQEKKAHYCQFHPQVAWCDHVNARGRKIMGCPACSGVADSKRGITGPLHRYPDAQYWRERPLSKAERDHKPKRGT